MLMMCRKTLALLILSYTRSPFMNSDLGDVAEPANDIFMYFRLYDTFQASKNGDKQESFQSDLNSPTFITNRLKYILRHSKRHFRINS